MQINLEQYKVLFLIVTAVLALLVASPALQHVLVYPQTEFFTEFGMLGPEHMAENYPYNITAGQNYTLFLDVVNHLGSCSYYAIGVKFRNQTQPAPDRLAFKPSSMPLLFEIPLFVANEESNELPLTFSFNYSFQNVTRLVYSNVNVPEENGVNSTAQLVAQNVTVLRAEFSSLSVNGAWLDLTGYTSDWNSTTNQYYGNLIFELWVYSESTGLQYHERFVDLKVNFTDTVTSSGFVN